MQSEPILIAGAGIGGLATALTLHQIGVRCLVLEAVDQLKPLGVGISLQPNAVRELYDLGLDESALDSIGVKTQEWALVGLNGQEIYSEPRGTWAGSRWPQYSVHRGQLQMLLLEAVKQRLGLDSVHLGHRLTGYENESGGGVTAHVETANGEQLRFTGSLLIAADGLHSAARAQMYPDQPPMQWGGKIMWRGTSPDVPIRTGASFVGLGTHAQRLVFYPITQPDSATGLATINWIAEITESSTAGRVLGDWNKSVKVPDIIGHFANWKFDWLDVEELMNKAEKVYEYPMVDRDPIPSWQDGGVALLGDAAHVMYPTGSNGASQAIVDARVLGACLVEHGISQDALASYDDQLCSRISDVVLRNRGDGPFGILSIIDKRCGGVFDDVNEVISKKEMQTFMSTYKTSAGLAIEALNNAPQTIPPGSKLKKPAQ